MSLYDETVAYERARQDAARLRGFYVHCLVFVLGNTTNVIVNWMTRQDGGNWWFQWALIAWTVALAVHGLTIAGRRSWFGPDWEQRKIRQYMTKTTTQTRNVESDRQENGERR